MKQENIKRAFFWLGWIWSGIAFFIILMIQTHFFPSELEKNGRKMLCELKQYKYCNEEEKLKIIEKQLLKKIK